MAAEFIAMNNLVCSTLPKDIISAPQAGLFYSLKDNQGITFLLIQGAWAGGTPAVTLQQALDVAGGTPKALGFTERWQKAASVAGSWVRTAVVSNTFNLPNLANQLHVVEVSAADLDRAAGYDCVALNLGTPGANADLLCVIAVLWGSRYAGDPAKLSDPLVD